MRNRFIETGANIAKMTLLVSGFHYFFILLFFSFVLSAFVLILAVFLSF
jgi:hypothetical protein